jgi:pseudolysin
MSFSILLSRALQSFCVFIVLSFALSANAAEHVSLQHMSFHDLQQIMDIVVSDDEHPALTKSVNSLQFISKHTDVKKVTHSRFQQKYLGFPVFGGYAISHKASQRFLSLNGTIYKNLQNDLGIQPPFSSKQKQTLFTKFIAPHQGENITEKQILPIVYVDESHQAFWAYKVSALVSPINSMPQKPSAIINALTGIEIESWDDIKTSHSLVNGVGFGGNQKIGRHQFGVNLPLLSISRDDFSGVCYMENKQVKVVDMNYRYEGVNTPMAFTCPFSPADNAYWTGYDENGYDNTNGAYSPSNDALYIGNVIKKMYKDVYGVEALFDRHTPMQLIMRVHYGRDYANAFWDGRQMTFGDGDRMLHPLVSLGIGAHEVSHGFTEQNANLIYFGQSGGMNESFSDMAAQAAEYYLNKENSWHIGQDILKSTYPIKALRYMDWPSKDGRSIDYADHYRKGMDVHYSSGVYNRLFYLLASSPQWNTNKAFDVMIKANMDYWTPKSTFDEGACGVIYAAEDLDLSVRDVKKVLDEVMINYDLC